MTNWFSTAATTTTATITTTTNNSATIPTTIFNISSEDVKVWEIIGVSNFLVLSDQPHAAIFFGVYVAILTLSLLGNVLVIVVIRTTKSMRNVTNYFLFNLAVADLLVTLVCIPLTAAEIVSSRRWLFGNLLCKLSSYFQGVSVGASVLTIMSLSLDRYIAVKHPVKSRRLCTPCHVMGAIVVIWGINAIIMIPLATTKKLVNLSNLIPKTKDEPIYYCFEEWPSHGARQVFDGFLFALIFLAPSSVVAFAYLSTGFSLLKRDKSLRDQAISSDSQKRIMAGRRRLAMMLLLVAGLFVLSWLPYTIFNLYVDFFANSDDAVKTITIAYAVLVVGHSHCAQNPILYCILNRPFKRRLAKVFGCHRRPSSQTQLKECSTKQIEDCLQELTREYPARDTMIFLGKRNSLKSSKNSRNRQLVKTFSISSSAHETTGLFDKTHQITNSASTLTKFEKYMKVNVTVTEKVFKKIIAKHETSAPVVANKESSENFTTQSTGAMVTDNGFLIDTQFDVVHANGVNKMFLSFPSESALAHNLPKTLPTTSLLHYHEKKDRLQLGLQLSISEPSTFLTASSYKS